MILKTTRSCLHPFLNLQTLFGNSSARLPVFQHPASAVCSIGRFQVLSEADKCLPIPTIEMGGGGIEPGEMAIPYGVPVPIEIVGPRGIKTFEENADAPWGKGYTEAGHSLTKHGAGQRKTGNSFPPATGTPAQINTKAIDVVKEILNAPGTTFTARHHAKFGDVSEIRDVNGLGLRYDNQGHFIGFLEPNSP